MNQKKIYCFHCIRMACKYRNPGGPSGPDPDKGDATSDFRGKHNICPTWAARILMYYYVINYFTQKYSVSSLMSTR